MAVYANTSATLKRTKGYVKKTCPENFASEKESELWDCGSINNSIIEEEEDYGNITECCDQVLDYGKLEDIIVEITYILINLTAFADPTLIRVSVGGVVFALFGRDTSEIINKIFDTNPANNIVKFKRITAADSVEQNSSESVFLMQKYEVLP